MFTRFICYFSSKSTLTYTCICLNFCTSRNSALGSGEYNKNNKGVYYVMTATTHTVHSITRLHHF